MAAGRDPLLGHEREPRGHLARCVGRRRRRVRSQAWRGMVARLLEGEPGAGRNEGC